MEEKQKNNKSKKIIIILSSLVILSITTFIIYKKVYKDKSDGSVLSSNSSTRTFDYNDICNSGNRQRPDFEEMPEDIEPPSNMEPPSDMRLPDGMNNNDNFSDMRTIIKKFCEDGEIDEEEASELDELFEDMPSNPRSRSNF